MDNPDLQRLLEQAQSGDQAAFESLISSYEKLVFNVAFRMMGNRDDALDMSQEALIKVYRNIEKCAGITAFKAWICTITTNTCLDELRKRKIRKAESLDSIYETEDGVKVKQTPANDPGPSEALLRKEDMRSIAEAINSLTDDYREAILLRDVNGLSYQEIADNLDLSIGTVKSRISRARGTLKQILSAGEQISSGSRLIN